MGKRHHTSRRRSYGRRQHELRERTERDQLVRDEQLGHELVDREQDGLSFRDLSPITRRLTFAVGD
ncbi:MAG: hypothetical protein QOF11_991 [Chloroflexota bacterium]|jgi:hypothetical protein|nr:hypothetical protein [Chloroflexota bacterium]